MSVKGRPQTDEHVRKRAEAVKAWNARRRLLDRRRMKIEHRTHGVVPLEEIAPMIEDFHAGMTLKQLGDRYGVTKSAIWGLLRRRGIIERRHEPKTIRERDEFGAVVTVREQTTRELRSLHEPGQRLEAMRVLAERIDRMPGDWKVIAYSTPETITSDMRGVRSTSGSTRKARSTKSGMSVRGQRRRYSFLRPERRAFARIHRLDLVEPTIWDWNE